MFGKVSFITCATAYPRNTRYRRRVRLEWVRYPDRVPTGLLRAVQCRAGGSEQSLRVIRHWIVRRGDTRRCAELKQVALPEYRGGDRKSVVQGKSVSVRVDLGGRLVITIIQH